MCPRGAKLLTGEGSLLGEATLVAHCLLIETGDDLVLVDTGFGTKDVADIKRLNAPFRAMVRPKPSADEPATKQIEKLGLDPKAVKHIAITHLDLDHAGGLHDFPDAQVHVNKPELDHAMNPPRMEQLRYAKVQWEHGPKWQTHEPGGDKWFGFDSVQLLPGVDGEIALIPLPGHTKGHAGIAINTPDGWLLHCGDAYFHRDEMATPPSTPPGLVAFERMNDHDTKTRKQNQERLRELARDHGAEVRLINAHDPHLLPGFAA